MMIKILKWYTLLKYDDDLNSRFSIAPFLFLTLNSRGLSIASSRVQTPPPPLNFEKSLPPLLTTSPLN